MTGTNGIDLSHLDLSRIELLGIDIDGTMLGTDGVLSDRTRRALHAARDAGLHVVPTTGRPLVVSTDVIEALGIDDVWIFANGAITRHLGRSETLRAHWIDPEVAKGFVRDLRSAMASVRFAIEFEVDVAYEPGFEQVVPSVPPGDPTTDVLEAIDRGPVQKVLVFDAARTRSPEALDELYAASTRLLDDRGVVSYSGLSFIEIGAEAVTKATALDHLSQLLGLDRSRVATFGDNHNDVPMLEWAGHSFAMANATDDAKAAANEVVGHTNDDGLAQVIEAIIQAR